MKIPKSYKRVKRGVVREGDIVKRYLVGELHIEKAEGLIGATFDKDGFCYGWEVYRKPKRYEVTHGLHWHVFDIKKRVYIYENCTKHYAYKALKMLNGES